MVRVFCLITALDVACRRPVRKGSAFPDRIKTFPEAQPQQVLGMFDGKPKTFRTVWWQAAVKLWRSHHTQLKPQAEPFW